MEEQMMHEAGESAYRRLPKNDLEAITMLARSAKTPKQRSSLSSYMLSEFGDDGDRPENWSGLA